MAEAPAPRHPNCRRCRRCQAPPRATTLPQLQLPGLASLVNVEVILIKVYVRQHVLSVLLQAGMCGRTSACGRSRRNTRVRPLLLLPLADRCRRGLTDLVNKTATGNIQPAHLHDCVPVSTGGREAAVHGGHRAVEGNPVRHDESIHILREKSILGGQASCRIRGGAPSAATRRPPASLPLSQVGQVTRVRHLWHAPGSQR